MPGQSFPELNNGSCFVLLTWFVTFFFCTYALRIFPCVQSVSLQLCLLVLLNFATVRSEPVLIRFKWVNSVIFTFFTLCLYLDNWRWLAQPILILSKVKFKKFFNWNFRQIHSLFRTNKKPFNLLTRSANKLHQ